MPTTTDQINALCRCSFPVGSGEKRFVRQMTAALAKAEEAQQEPTFTPRQVWYLNFLAHRYRGQTGGCKANDCPVCVGKLPLDQWPLPPDRVDGKRQRPSRREELRAERLARDAARLEAHNAAFGGAGG